MGMTLKCQVSSVLAKKPIFEMRQTEGQNVNDE